MTTPETMVIAAPVIKYAIDMLPESISEKLGSSKRLLAVMMALARGFTFVDRSVGIDQIIYLSFVTGVGAIGIHHVEKAVTLSKVEKKATAEKQESHGLDESAIGIDPESLSSDQV